MKVVADTNIIVSGLFWRGSPRQVLDAARSGMVDLYTSPTLLAELEDVLGRPSFSSRMPQADATLHDLLMGIAALATIVHPLPIGPVLLSDPDDDAVLACAATVRADAIVSGDSHLLALREYQGIPVINAAELLLRLRS